MWLICMKVQRSNFGIKVAGYMGEAGYTVMSTKLGRPSLGRGTDTLNLKKVPIFAQLSDPRIEPLFLVSH